MTNKKEQSKISKIFWRIAISVIGLALILLALVSISLYFFGESTTAKVTTRRYGGADNNYAASKRYEWSVDYTFRDKEGKKYSGHTTKRGSDMSAKVSNKVYYFASAPFINSLESEVEPNAGQPVLIALGTLLLVVMNKKKKKIRGKSKAVKKSKGKVNPNEFHDYDDSIE